MDQKKIIHNYLFFITLVLMMTSCGSYKKVISSKTGKIVKKMSKSDGYYAQYVGYSGAPSEEYKIYDKLLRAASKEELIVLSSHKNPIVRSYVSLALSNKLTSDEFFPIVVSRLNDTATVETLNGCIGGMNIVGDIFVDNFRTINNAYHDLDSLLFYTDYPIYSDDRARYNNRYFKSDSSNAISFLESKADQGDMISMQALLKSGDIKYVDYLDTLFKKSSSVYLRSLLYYEPDEIHKRHLELLASDALKTLGGFSSEWRLLYDYISSYKDEWALELLLQPLDSVANPKIQKYYAKFIGDAIEKNPSVIFDTVAYVLWQDYRVVSKNNLEYLIENYPNRVSFFYEIGENYKAIEIAGQEYNNEGRLSLFSELMKLDRIQGNNDLRRIISDCSIHDFQKIVIFINEENIDFLKENLIEVFSKEDNIYYHFSLLDRLGEIKITQANKEMFRSAFESNIEIQDSWGYEDAKSKLEKILN